MLQFKKNLKIWLYTWFSKGKNVRWRIAAGFIYAQTGIYNDGDRQCRHIKSTSKKLGRKLALQDGFQRTLVNSVGQTKHYGHFKNVVSNGRCRIRTCDRLIKSQLTESDKPTKHNKLQLDDSSTVASAYKENPKTAQNHHQNMPEDLAEIVAVWPELPEHIKAAIKALIQTHIRGNS